MKNNENAWSLVGDRWSNGKAATNGRDAIRAGVGCRKLGAVLVLLAFTCSPPIFAQSPPPSSTDDELLKQLNEKSTDDVDRQLFGDKNKEKKDDGGAGQGDEKLQEQLRRELGAAAEKEDDNPVLGIARRMMDVQTRVADADGGEKVQEEQKRIVADLDKLIEQAKKSCGKCSGSCSKPGQASSRTPKPGAKPGSKPGTKPSTKPAQQSSQRPVEKKTVKPDPEEMKNLIKDLWGELPPNVREQMMQNPTEQFVPQYESMIEEYYRRLLEEKP